MGEIYKELLTVERRRLSTRGPLALPDEVESDRSRVLYSSSFRRLQGKTQVFPLDENAAVRTRLTHSFEVSHVGRFLAASVLKIFKERGELDKVGLGPDEAAAFPTIVETACLLHDIGNPPFGHFGEQAISQWFGRNLNDLTAMAGCVFADEHADLKNDFLNFDGNPQGFRILSRIAGADEFGFNLTLTQMAATIKYVCLPSQKDSTTALKKKAGVFFSEREALADIQKRFLLKEGQRFPLAYLMEAADDISYCLSDIEDGVEKGIIKFDDFVEKIRERTSDDKIREFFPKNDGSVSPVERVVGIRSRVIRHLVGEAAKDYVNSHAQICAGTRDELIESSSPCGRLLQVIKEHVRESVYSHEVPQQLELSGLSIIEGLLERFRPLLALKRENFDALLSGGGRKLKLDRELRLLGLVAKRHKEAYRIEVGKGVSDQAEWALRGHMLVDFISGMTDHFSLRLYQKLSGIRL
ncbi:dGTPase [Solimonas sp. K1W22B-7]|uniref:dGTPase n=1 Tax=Solimonas sp. K1W22B-7 TaxID=2303331 RepID=UPI0013C4AC68|nr:dGTPase [Solimonas sp. K1W22B-7]